MNKVHKIHTLVGITGTTFNLISTVCEQVFKRIFSRHVMVNHVEPDQLASDEAN